MTEIKEQEVSDERVQWRVRKTVLEMLRDRGYDTKNQENEQTFEDYLKIVESGNTVNIIAYKRSGDEVAEAPLTDRTKIAGTNWANLKPEAMAEHYEQKPWYAPLSLEDKKLLESLRGSQNLQGDLHALNIQNPEANVQQEPIYVHFMGKEGNNKIDKDFIKNIVRFMDDWSINNADPTKTPLVNTILIVRSGATAIARKSLAEIAPFRVEIFS